MLRHSKELKPNGGKKNKEGKTKRVELDTWCKNQNTNSFSLNANQKGKGGKRNASELKLCVVFRTFWPIESHCYKEGKGLVKRQKGNEQMHTEMQQTVCRVHLCLWHDWADVGLCRSRALRWSKNWIPALSNLIISHKLFIKTWSWNGPEPASLLVHVRDKLMRLQKRLS